MTLATISATAETLPTSEMVGDSAVWNLPDRDGTLTVRARFLGVASSRRDYHQHEDSDYARRGERCGACRWFEPRIFRELDGDERYLVLYAGRTIVPGESTYVRTDWALSGFELVEVLTTRQRRSSCRDCKGSGRTDAGSCFRCGGTGTIRSSGARLTVPAARVLAQAASLDEEVTEAWTYTQRVVS